MKWVSWFLLVALLGAFWSEELAYPYGQLTAQIATTDLVRAGIILGALFFWAFYFGGREYFAATIVTTSCLVLVMCCCGIIPGLAMRFGGG